MNAPEPAKARVAFEDLIDLASAKLGGRVLWANDEFFAGKDNLLQPGRGIFIPDKFTENGKWMDGWETRRRRAPGHDTCIIRLGLPGVIRGIDVDTHHFVGNFPEYCSLEALEVEGDASDEFLTPYDAWTELLPVSRLHGDCRNLFPIPSERRWTHLRFHIYPDGGVARLRVHGEVRPDVDRLRTSGAELDLAALANGGTVAACNDQFFGPKDNLLLPGRAANMGEGWETRRKRVPGFDWIVVRLAARGLIRRVEVDTNHFKGNCPDSCALEGIDLPGPVFDFANTPLDWQPLLPKTKLTPHHQHLLEKELVGNGPFTHVRMSIFPDGGISRLRLFGTLA